MPKARQDRYDRFGAPGCASHRNSIVPTLQLKSVSRAKPSDLETPTHVCRGIHLGQYVVEIWWR